MDLKQLNAFIAIANVRSFSAAATTTGLSQPTLSRLLKQLEADMGVVLVDRYHRPLHLTAAGVFFYDKISGVLTEIETVTSMTQRLSAPSTTLNIGFVPSVLYGLLPEIIATLKRNKSNNSANNSPNNSPNIEVNLKDISSYQQIEALKTGEIDIGFGRFAHQDPWIQQILLRHERYVVALPKAHPLAHVRKQRLIDLANNRLILYHQTHLPVHTANTSLSQIPTAQTDSAAKKDNIRTDNKTDAANVSLANSITEPLLYLFAQYGISPFMTTKVSDLQVALGLVAAGEGITLVPASLQTVRTDQISYQRLVHENVTSPIYLHTLKDFVHPKVPDLLNAIYQVYEKRGITYRRQKFV
ncbi:LysR family transcriptional regulator [Psychrobacter sp. LV10R520-6]|uniref:LysR family transcriptional regulator n=1 Tax=Psychrobacter sp. LV10R520-6 TaxID=1415574 RepID=UPI0024C62741|nr:LysR family transcriptional regulator [Psychrobacter sp. LV10R520-6]SNT69809.1 DNA-binding transcriptional regulator, LysR family [Psychrobacter sp. LV10R520-6]